ncbi:MAG: hypothetical protein V3V00_10360 [Saprospiraceae bacterium]
MLTALVEKPMVIPLVKAIVVMGRHFLTKNDDKYFWVTSAASSVKWWLGFDEYFEAEQGGKLTILAS